MTKLKVGSIDKTKMLKIERSISRDIEISTGMRINHHKVFRSKKQYTRKDKHKSMF